MRSYLKNIYDRFIRIRGTPGEIALGFALGIFIGFTPTMGFQIAIGVFFAALLKWNKIGAVIGVHITNPLSAPFIYGLTYFIGAKFMGLKQPFVWQDAFQLHKLAEIIAKAPSIFLALTIGGGIVGIPAALLGYHISYSLVAKYQKSLKHKLEISKAGVSEKLRRRKNKKRQIKE